MSAVATRPLRRAALAACLVSALCTPAPAGDEAPENVLLVILDDAGIDVIGAYADHPAAGPTPTIDCLASQGVLFRNAWAQPLCSSSRAALMTGREPVRTGLGSLARADDPQGLPLSELTIAELVAPVMTPALLGKWHIGGTEQGPSNPNDQGFVHYAGSLANLDRATNTYRRWRKTTNGETEVSLTYATTDTTNDAIELMATLPQPWLIVVSYNAPHKPFHRPPPELTTLPVPLEREQRSLQLMLEGLDTELERLLLHAPDDMTGMVIGDNGTYGPCVSFPLREDRQKGTLFEGGVHVPWIVWGPRVRYPGSECLALIQITDVFATVAEIAGLESQAEDSVSLLPYLEDPTLPSRRSHIFAERFRPNGFGPFSWHRHAVRGQRYKLISSLFDPEGVSDELFDLWYDPYENVNLLDGQLDQREAAALEELRELLAAR